MTVSFEDLRQENVNRCNESYHPLFDWSPTDWACAMAGECGELCNLIKKLRRLVGPETSYHQALGQMRGQIADELADTMIYADLLAARLGINLGQAVARKFNATSELIGSTRRLREAATAAGENDVPA